MVYRTFHLICVASIRGLLLRGNSVTWSVNIEDCIQSNIKPQKEHENFKSPSMKFSGSHISVISSFLPYRGIM